MHQPFYHLAQRIFNTPVAIHPDKSALIISALADRLGITNLSNIKGDNLMMSSDDDYFTGEREKESGYDILKEFAIIQVHGTLVQKTGTLRPYSGMTGYDSIRNNLNAALNDNDVKAIVLDIDSPGGEVAGCFDLVDDIYNARDAKPIYAICNEIAYSAAYAIASAAQRISVPRTGGVGSIGVICCHVDYSAALKEAGIKVTMIKYGEFKGDGAAEFPLSSSALKRIQKDINQMGELFVETVARNRRMSVKKIRDTEAACYLGKDAIDLGLADTLASPNREFENLINLLS